VLHSDTNIGLTQRERMTERAGSVKKYEWIELNAYETWESLVSYVKKVLRDFGSKYVVNFA